MKNIVSKVKSFVTFELPVQPAYVHAKFSATHEAFKLKDPDWTRAATRQKLIYFYWFRLVPEHFATILVMSLLLVSVLNAIPIIPKTHQVVTAFFSIAVITYPILSLFHYKPIFLSYYLPNLENAKAVHIGAENELLDKCRRAQLPNFSLALLFYVFAKMNRLDIFRNDDRVALLLVKIYGVDQGSIKKSLDLLIARDVSNLSMRKRTEIQNRFEVVYLILQELNIEEAIENLKKIELRFLAKASWRKGVTSL